MGVFFNKKNQLDVKFILSIIVVLVVLPLAIYSFYASQEPTSTIYSVEILNQCAVDFECTRSSLEDIAKTEDQTIVLETFDEIMTIYDENSYYCHSFVHPLAAFLYDYLGGLPQALTHASQKCGGALYHGVVEAFFYDQRSKKNDPESIILSSLCPPGDSKYSIVQRQCTHGVGHGLIISYDDVLVAHQRCDEFQEIREQESCAKGAFMQNVVQSQRNQYSTFDDNDLYFPCNSVSPKYAPPCYLYHSTYIFQQNQFDLTQSFEDCDNIIPQDHIQYCYAGLGRQMSPKVFNYEQDAYDVCEIGQPQFRSYCYTAIVLTTVNHLGNDSGFEFCKTLLDKYKTDCYDQLGIWIGLLAESEQERVEECSKAESLEYSEVCVNADTESLFFSYDVEF